jgi:hypothetical protein
MDRDTAVGFGQQAIRANNHRLIEALRARAEAESPGLLTLHPGVDMNSAPDLTRAFADCDGVVLYNTANTSRAGRW